MTTTLGLLQQPVEAIDTPDIAWVAVLPHLILIAGAVLLLTVVSVLKRTRLPHGFYAGWTIVTALASFASAVPLWSRVQDSGRGAFSAVSGALGVDGFSIFAGWIICIAVVLTALLFDGYLRREGLEAPEFYVLVLLSASGGTIMAASNDLIVLFIGLEILSIAVYVLAALHTRRVTSQEAGIKYFVLGAFASAFLLYGIAMTYGATGTTSLLGIRDFLSETVLLDDALLMAGLALMLVGLGFKVSAVPFHSWTPDVYQGAPTPVTAFMASAVKVAGFAALLRVFVATFGPTYAEQWQPAIYGLAVLTLVVGAGLAIVQTNVKRMLAYSSINHAGFILVGVQAASDEGTSSALFYLGAYTFMVIGSFAIITVVGRRDDGLHEITDYKGLARTRPALALMFTVVLLAQAGAPFTGGFFAKFSVIKAAVDAHSYGLAIVAMLSSVIAAYLYLRIVVGMYMAGEADEPLAGPPVRIPVAVGVVVAIAVGLTLAIGIVPGPFTDLTNDATAVLTASAG